MEDWCGTLAGETSTIAGASLGRSRTRARHASTLCLGGAPEGLQVGRGEVSVGDSLLAGLAVHRYEPVTEALARPPQGVLGIDLQLPGEAHNREEEVAHLVEDLVGVGGAGRFGQLPGLLPDGFGGARRGLEVEAQPSSPLLHPGR